MYLKVVVDCGEFKIENVDMVVYQFVEFCKFDFFVCVVFGIDLEFFDVEIVLVVEEVVEIFMVCYGV